MLPEPIGARISRFRRRRGLTQEQLAARMQTCGHRKIVQQRVAQWESGARVVRPEELVSLARILCVPISELLGVPDYSPE